MKSNTKIIGRNVNKIRVYTLQSTIKDNGIRITKTHNHLLLNDPLSTLQGRHSVLYQHFVIALGRTGS